MRAEPSKLFNADPGGQAPVRSDLTAGVVAAQWFAARRDIPDVLGFADFAFAPGETYELAMERLAAGVGFTGAQVFPLQKGSAGATRPMTDLHPLDYLVLRGFVGRVSAALRASVDASSVLNGLIDHPGPGWRPMKVSPQYRERRRLREERYNRPDIGAVGFFDAKEFFPSCRHSTLAALLDAAGAPTGAIEAIITMLGAVFPGGVGLPIGFEGSGPMANLFFRQVDAELRASGSLFRCHRTTDTGMSQPVATTKG